LQKRQKAKPVYIFAPAIAAIFILVFGGLFYMRRQHGSTQGDHKSNTNYFVSVIIRYTIIR